MTNSIHTKRPPAPRGPMAYTEARAVHEARSLKCENYTCLGQHNSIIAQWVRRAHWRPTGATSERYLH